jgi:hypothetical protein
LKLKYSHIAFLILIGMFSFQSLVAFAEQPKGSRLNIKPTVKSKSLTFKKGKSVLAFKPAIGNLDLQRTKTVKLYFNNYLISRNLSKLVNKEVVFSNAINNNPKNVSLVEASVSKVNEEEEVVEPGERFYTSEGFVISNIFPNPADDVGFFDYSLTNNNFKEVKVQFFNVLGTPMNVTLLLDKAEKKTRVYLKDFSNGIYFYQLTGDGKILATKKLLVRHNN